MYLITFHTTVHLRLMCIPAHSLHHCGAAPKVNVRLICKNNNKSITLPRTFGPEGAVRAPRRPALQRGRLHHIHARCAPAATNPKVYAKHYTPSAAACRGYHIGSRLQELPHTICDPVVPIRTGGSMQGWVLYARPLQRKTYSLLLLLL
jgi:hypothetical protein